MIVKLMVLWLLRSWFYGRWMILIRYSTNV